MGLENLLLIGVVLGSLIFMAKDVKLGSIMLLLTSAGLTMWFYAADYNYKKPLVLMLVSIAFMALLLYPSSRANQERLPV